MTAIIAWLTHDGKPGAASLYLASDSRITTKRAGGGINVKNDNFQKVYTSPDTPDILAFCGPINGVSSLMDALINTAAKIRKERTYGDGAESQYSEDLFQTVLRQGSYSLLPSLRVFHGYRFGARRFGLTSMTIDDHVEPNFKTHVLPKDWGLLASDGSGDKMVGKKRVEYIELESESKGYSRWFWMSFYASLAKCSEVTCGGPPQLAVLYGHNGGNMLGVYFGDAAFVAGQPCVRSDIEYRDELFQRVDAYGNLLPDAQPHARMGKPRLFKFSP